MVDLSILYILYAYVCTRANLILHPDTQLLSITAFCHTGVTNLDSDCIPYSNAMTYALLFIEPGPISTHVLTLAFDFDIAPWGTLIFNRI